MKAHDVSPDEMKKLPLIAFLLFSHLLFAQKLHFRLINGKTLNPVAGARIYSFANPSLMLNSDRQGRFVVDVLPNDTLSVLRAYYYPIHLNIASKNFDTNHEITLAMVASNEENYTQSKNLSGFENFEYHFVHDSLGEESHIRIRTFEGVDAAQLRKQITMDLTHLASVRLLTIDISPVTKRRPKSVYRLKAK